METEAYIMKFTVITQGCKVNQYDSGVISQKMLGSGFELAERGEKPDIIIINSCTVTENSDKKAFRIISGMRRDFPDAVIVLTGCYPQAFAKEAAMIQEADIVTGNAGKENIPQLIKDYFNEKKQVRKSFPHKETYCESEGSFKSSNTRPFIKIEDGCDRFCSYCIIPFSRGRVRSRSLESIFSEINFYAKQGCKEAVLTGINLSCYGNDIGLSLYDAVKTAAEVPEIERVRLSSLEPELFDKNMIEKLASIKKLCPHFHLSLQSGCSQTLKRMNRNYSSQEYAKIVENLRKNFEKCAVTTDVMVGFAGESDEEFEKSAKFVKEIGFSRIHVFTYSIRPGTAAAKMEDQIERSVKEKRYNIMSEIAKNSQKLFYEKNIGKVYKVLIERQSSPDFIHGYTENYIPVRIYGEKAARHSILSVKITKAQKDFCEGEICS